MESPYIVARSLPSPFPMLLFACHLSWWVYDIEERTKTLPSFVEIVEVPADRELIRTSTEIGRWSLISINKSALLECQKKFRNCKNFLESAYYKQKLETKLHFEKNLASQQLHKNKHNNNDNNDFNFFRRKGKGKSKSKSKGKRKSNSSESSNNGNSNSNSSTSYSARFSNEDLELRYLNEDLFTLLLEMDIDGFIVYQGSKATNIWDYLANTGIIYDVFLSFKLCFKYF